MEHINAEAEQRRRVWEAASGLRRDVWSKQVFLRGVIEISSHCARNCLYCGLRAGNTSLTRYRLSTEEIFEQACVIKELGIGTVELESGEDPAFGEQTIAGIIRRIRDRLGLTVSLSLGERGERALKLWRDSGAERYRLNVESADPALYSKLRPGCKLDTRLETLDLLARLGYEVGSGLMAGLPESLNFPFSRSLEVLARLGLDMQTINPFVPHPATPMRAVAACAPGLILQRLAEARLAMPTAHLRVPDALSLHDDALLLEALSVADTVPLSLTPLAQARQYAVYFGKNGPETVLSEREEREEAPEERAWRMRRLLLDAGFIAPSGPGGAWRMAHLGAPGKEMEA